MPTEQTTNSDSVPFDSTQVLQPTVMPGVPVESEPIPQDSSEATDMAPEAAGGSGEGVGAGVVSDTAKATPDKMDTASKEAHSTTNFVLDLSTGEEVSASSADMPVSSTDGLVSEPGPENEIASSTIETIEAVKPKTPASAESSQPSSETTAKQASEAKQSPPSLETTAGQSGSFIKSLLGKLKEKLSFRTEKRLAKIMELTRKNGSVVNTDVQKLLHVSSASATRYLNKLVKRGSLKVSGSKTHTKYLPS